jgi:hypothetical protein
MNSTSRKKVEALVAEARSLVPETLPPALPPIDGCPGIPQWHQFEDSLWSIGEQIRQTINSEPRLRSDRELYAEFLAIIQNRHGMRGRQSFVLLFAYKPCVSWARHLASLTPDADIDGHIISALYKMRACGFSRVVAPFLSSSATWIAKEARRYLSFDLDAPIPHERNA